VRSNTTCASSYAPCILRQCTNRRAPGEGSPDWEASVKLWQYAVAIWGENDFDAAWSRLTMQAVTYLSDVKAIT
jgi:hypothetical protein